ncbi:hypothetical protein FUA26_11725 [Seonamhaeicola algicola]|uniref:CBM-cenC domain-containing protein n=1 Tax=Seonamhaeicola algicola TaxID=1719036 RepID=A0A5C7AUF2_9FLAO|nr:carbohydrate binding domain-containing protein [Seonamhaeicola algicola]TXE10135.1 hypothetical protein FUA26_11725 [Seonamhaeicola algicola]
MKKHNIKYNLIMVIAILAVIFTACNKDDEYDQPNSFSDVGWYIAYEQSPWPDTLLTNKDDYLTFSDLSQNAISHKWEIESGNFFLEGPIQRLDSIFDDKIIGSGSSEDKTVSVLFKNSGYNHVRLFNIFKDSVTFRGPTEEDNISAVKVGENWVIDKTFVVDVYDTIVPTIRIERSNGEILNHTSTDTIYVEAGDAINVFDLTETGRPDDWNWNIGGSTSTEKDATLVLKKLGAFNGTLTLRRTGQNIPGDYEQYKIPAPFKVIPSSQPFRLTGNVYELEDQTIVVPFNGEFAPFIDHESYFTVTVNGGANPVTISNVSTDPNDATLLWITLNETIYRSDNITVSYDGNGTFKSTDTREPEAFTDAPVTMHNYNYINSDVMASFEEAGTGWEERGGPTSIEYITTAPSGEPIPDGNYILKIVSSGGGQGAILKDFGSFEPGVDYKLSYWVYAEPGSANSCRADFLVGNNDAFNFWQSLNPGPAGWQAGAAPGAFGEWRKIDNKIINVDNANDHSIFFRPNGAGTYYFDNIYIEKVDVRP